MAASHSMDPSPFILYIIYYLFLCDEASGLELVLRKLIARQMQLADALVDR